MFRIAILSTQSDLIEFMDGFKHPIYYNITDKTSNITINGKNLALDVLLGHTHEENLYKVLPHFQKEVPSCTENNDMVMARTKVSFDAIIYIAPSKSSVFDDIWNNEWRNRWETDICQGKNRALSCVAIDFDFLKCTPMECVEKIPELINEHPKRIFQTWKTLTLLKAGHQKNLNSSLSKVPKEIIGEFARMFFHLNTAPHVVKGKSLVNPVKRRGCAIS